MSIQLHPHQVEAIDRMRNGCILYGDVGVGKTITSLAYYYTKACEGVLNTWGSMDVPKDLYVITTAKVRDSKAFEIQAAAMGIHADPELSTNGVKIVVDSWNNLHKYVGVKDAFFIFDEQRVVGYGAWARAFIKIARSNEWILLSATPGDTWLDYIPVFIANGWYKHKTDFLDQHVIWTPRVKYPKVLRYQNVGLLVRRRNQVLVRMSYKSHTVRHSVDIWCDYDRVLFDKVVKSKWHVYEQRPLRDASELFSVMRKVVNSDSSRLQQVQKLMMQHPKVIVFYNFDYELEMLRELGESLSMDSSSLSTDCTQSGVESSSESIRQLKERLDTSPKESKSSSKTQGDGLFDPTLLSGTKSSTEEKQSLLLASNKRTDTTASPEPGTDRTQNLDQLAKTAAVQDALPDITSSSRTESSATEENVESSSSVPTQPPASTDNFAVAEWNGHKHEEIPATERWLYLVQYRAGAEGWNCIETDAIVFWSQTYSYRDWHQAHGRIDRLNTPFTDLYYYNLITKSPIDVAVRKALKAKKNFNEKDLTL